MHVEIEKQLREGQRIEWPWQHCMYSSSAFCSPPGACPRHVPEMRACKIRYLGKHTSEVKVNDESVEKEWVEFPLGGRLELMADPKEVNHMVQSMFVPRII